MADDFCFIAFSADFGRLLSHGPDRITALRLADALYSRGPIEVVCAGPLGRRVWHENLTLYAAQRLIRDNSLS
jgi:hypothetical protein